MTTDDMNSDQDLSKGKDEKIQPNSPETENNSDTENVSEPDTNNLAEAIVEESVEIIEEVKVEMEEDSENNQEENSEKNQQELMQGITVMETSISNMGNEVESAIENENTSEKEEATTENAVETAEKDTETPEVAPKTEEKQEKFLTLSEIITNLEALQKTATAESWSKDSKEFNKYKALGYSFLHAIEKAEKEKWIESGKAEEDFTFENSENVQFGELMQSFKKVQEEFHHIQENQQTKNLEIRHQIIEKLKNLNSNADAGTNLFKK